VGTVVSICAIAGTWIFLGLVLTGCGFVVRVAVGRVIGQPRTRPAVSDLWVGLAAVVAYLQLWNLGYRVDGRAWIAPLVAATVGAAVALRDVRPLKLRGTRAAAPLLAFATLGILWLADRSLAPVGSGDSALYHTGVIEYASKFATVPGLGNLHDRFAYASSHELFVAFLDCGVWAGAGVHLANGLLLGALLVDVCSRFLRRAPDLGSFTDRMAILLVPAAAIVVSWAPDARISSPELDTPTFVLVVVGALYLAEVVERGFASDKALASVGVLTTASVTRPLYWATTIVVGCLLFWAARRGARAVAPTPIRTGVLLASLPLLLAIGWSSRQAILSGYPFLPFTLVAAPVDWKMPRHAVDDLNLWIRSWARWPSKTPDQVMHSWHWLHPWFRTRFVKDLDVIAPLALLACVVPFLGGRAADPGRARRFAPMVVVLASSVVTLVAWFFTAPDPRFALAPIWLVPVSLAAWALPSPPRDGLALRVLLTLVAAICLAGIGEYELAFFLPACAAVWIALGAGARFRGGVRRQAWIAQIGACSVMLGALIISADRGAAYRPVRAYFGGTLGTVPVPQPAVVPMVTVWGLRTWQPAPVPTASSCWRVLLCSAPGTDGFPNKMVRLRGSDIADGFTARPP
jgi:hypothetical protein